MYSMDLVGPFEPKAWLKGMDRISPEYAMFMYTAMSVSLISLEAW